MEVFLETNSSKASESAVKKETLLSKGEIESSSKHHLLDVLAVRLRERERERERESVYYIW